MDEPTTENKWLESDLEISDLPGLGEKWRTPRALAFVRALAARPRLRLRLWRTVTLGLILALLFLSLSGSFPQLSENLLSFFAHPKPATAQPQHSEVIDVGMISLLNHKKVVQQDDVSPRLVSVTATLDALPQYCLRYTPTQNFNSPSFPGGVGSSPLWVTGFSGRAGQPAVLNHLKRAQPPQLGWYELLQLVSETNYHGAITLSGGFDGSDMPLWFGAYPPGITLNDAGLILTIIVNPLDISVSNHTTSDQQWSILPFNVYVPEAGCYYLKASWTGGSWTAYFMAGR